MSFMIFQNQKNAFVGQKNKKFKQSNNSHFSKRANPWFQVKNGYFSNFFFRHLQSRKMSFMIFWNEKTPFQAIKKRSPKKQKIDIFPNGLTHGFRSKLSNFSTFFSYGIYARKISFIILQKKKTPVQAIKTRSSNTRKIDIFPKRLTLGFGPKMAIFPNFFLQAIQARKMSFTIFQRKETPFQPIKTRS